MSRWLTLPSRKQMRRVLRASELAIARARPLTETQRRMNEVTRAMLDTLALAPFPLFSSRPMPMPKPKGSTATVTFRRYVIPTSQPIKPAILP